MCTCHTYCKRTSQQALSNLREISTEHSCCAFFSVGLESLTFILKQRLSLSPCLKVHTKNYWSQISGHNTPSKWQLELSAEVPVLLCPALWLHCHGLLLIYPLFRREPPESVPYPKARTRGGGGHYVTHNTTSGFPPSSCVTNLSRPIVHVLDCMSVLTKHSNQFQVNSSHH